MTYKYNLEQIDDSEYKLILIYETTKETMDFMFKKVITKLAKKHNLNVGGNPDIIERFDIPEDQRNLFCPVVKNAIRKHIRAISKEVRKDNFVILTSEVKNVIFARKSNNKWNIEVFVKGTFIFKWGGLGIWKQKNK